MNIKTLSEISLETMTMMDDMTTEPQQAMMSDQEFIELLVQSMTKVIWMSLERSLKELSPERASFARACGVHQKDPIRILTMLLMNLSSKEQSALSEVLGTLEPTH